MNLFFLDRDRMILSTPPFTLPLYTRLKKYVNVSIGQHLERWHSVEVSYLIDPWALLLKPLVFVQCRILLGKLPLKFLFQNFILEPSQIAKCMYQEKFVQPLLMCFQSPTPCDLLTSFEQHPPHNPPYSRSMIAIHKAPLSACWSPQPLTQLRAW